MLWMTSGLKPYEQLLLRACEHFLLKSYVQFLLKSFDYVLLTGGSRFWWKLYFGPAFDRFLQRLE